MRRRTLLTVALLGLLAVSTYGFWSRHLGQQNIWQPPGPERLLVFLAVACAWFGGWILARPAWLIPSTLAVVTVYTCAAVGVLPLAAAAFFLFACFVLGRLILPPVDGFRGTVPDLLCLLAGIGTVMWLGSLLAHFPVNYPATWLAILAIPLLVSPKTTQGCLRTASALCRPVPLGARRDYAALAIALVPLLAHWLVVLKPEASFDALSMHLVVPAYVANHHAWSFDFRHFTWAVMPMGAVWCYTVTYLLGGEFAARLLNFGLLAMLCCLIYAGARRWATRPAALLLAGLFAGTPMVQLVTGSIFVETFYAVLTVGALAALWRHHDTGHQPSLALSAFLLASALGVKMMAFPFAVPIGAILAWQLAGLWRRGQKRWLVVSAMLIVGLAPQPYLYSWLKTGNPAFPFVNNLFRSPYYAPALTPDPRFLMPLTWRTPFAITFETHRYWEGQDGSAGFHYLVFVPLLLLAIRRDWRFPEWTLLAAAGGGTLLGLILLPYIRYLYPGFALLTLSMALLLRDPAAFRRLAWGTVFACLALNLWFLPSSSWHHKTFCLNPFERNAAQRYLADAAPVRLLVDKLNRTYPGESALFLETMEVAGLRGTPYSNGWHYWLFMNRVQALDTNLDVFRLLQELGIRHFIFPDPATGPPVRDYQFRFFLEHYIRPEQDTGGFRLASLRPEFTGRDSLERAAAEDRPGPPAPPGAYDDFDPRVRFLAHWSHDTQFESAAHHSLAYTDAPHASFRFAFRGSAITWVYTRAVNRGVAEAFIDGQSRGEVDLYSPATIWQARTVFGGLKDGEHILEVKLAGRKNPQSSGTYVDLDELIVQ